MGGWEEGRMGGIQAKRIKSVEGEAVVTLAEVEIDRQINNIADVPEIE